MATVVNIALKDLPAAVRRDAERCRQAIVRGTLVGAERSRAILVRRTPTDQGQLKASWKVRGNHAAGLSDRELEIAETRNDAPHAGIVELGARPHGLSPEAWIALYEWVRRHPDLWAGTTLNRKGELVAGPRKNNRRARTTARGPLTAYDGPDPVITAITNAIAAKFRREGQKPTYFVRDSVPACTRATLVEITRELERTANETKAPAGSPS